MLSQECFPETAADDTDDTPLPSVSVNMPACLPPGTSPGTPPSTPSGTPPGTPPGEFSEDPREASDEGSAKGCPPCGLEVGSL